MKTQPFVPKSFRLTPEANDLLKAIAKKQGVRHTAVVELAIRHYAQALGVTPIATQPEPTTHQEPTHHA